MPPISGSDRSRRKAQSGVARSGLTRSGHTSAKVFVAIDGIQRAFNRPSAEAGIEVPSLKIKGRNGSTPNTLACRGLGFTPTRFDEVIVTLGSVNRHRREFGGLILGTTQRCLLSEGQTVFDLDCIEFGWQLNALVTGHFTGTADEIAIQLAQDYAPQWSTAKIQTGLPVVGGGISFTNVRLRVAYDRLAERVGATWKPDYRKRILFGTAAYLFLTNPQPLTLGLRTFIFDDRFAVHRDAGQRITRVHGEGGGGAALAEVSPGDTLIPVSEAREEWYGNAGGEVIIGESQQIVAYASRVAGGGGATAGPGAAPQSAPLVALAAYDAGSDLPAGLQQYGYLYVTASGRTKLSAIASIDNGFVAAPLEAAVAGAPTGGGNMDAGRHRYYPVFRTPTGSTTPGPVSNSVTVEAEVSTPTNTLSLVGTSRSGSGLDVGALYGYTCTFWDGGTRETTAPAGVTVDLSPSQNAGAILISSIPTPPPGWQVRFYRTKGNEGLYFLLPSGQAFGQFAQSSGGYYIDTKADSTLGAQEPAVNTTLKGTCQVTVPVSPDALVTHVDLYREFNEAGAATAELAFSVTNGTTSAQDTVANSGLGATVPSVNTAEANRVSVTYPAGPTGTTDIELYRLDTTFKLLHAVGSNTAGTFVDDVDPSALGMDAPTDDTSGLAQSGGQILPGDTEAPVANTLDFASSGWAIAANGRVVFRFTGKSGNSLTGIPATGNGAIGAAIPWGQLVTQAPMLIGVPTGSPSRGSITNTIPVGAAVNLWVTVDNVDAQADVSAKLDPENELGGLAGIIPDVVSDHRINRAEAFARASALLDSQDDESVTVTTTSWDCNAVEGRELTTNLALAPAVNETLRIQEVDVSWLDTNPPTFPLRSVSASSKRFTFEDLLRRARESM